MNFGKTTFLAAAAILTAGAMSANAFDMKGLTLEQYSQEETLNPIRPGGVNSRPFWNTYAKQFIYVPSFKFQTVNGAASYSFRVQDSKGVVHTFQADSPYAPLTPVWKDIPIGMTVVTVDALDAQGKTLGTAGKREFYRNAAFTNHYEPKARSYAEAARSAYEYLFNNRYINELSHKGPDLGLVLYCYPSKMHQSIIRGMVNYAEMEPAKRDQALAIAKGAAKYLMETAIPKGQPLEYLPLTYVGKNLTAAQYGDTIMMLYPAYVGSAMLYLYNTVKDPAYLDYAVKIGEQYLRLQQPDGSWYLVLKIADGKPKSSNRCVPVASILPFLEQLSQATGNAKYGEAAQKSLGPLWKTFETFNWEGQFEDVPIQRTPYANMTFHDAASMFLYLCPLSPKDEKLTAQAREVLRFSEDQFVIWEQPKNSNFLTPCALEQYVFHYPIDSACGKMIQFYLTMYDREQNPLDLAKARALGDMITRAQQNGRIPTQCVKKLLPPEEDWFNCAFETADALKRLAEYDHIKIN